jgi:hypothetical protein
MGVVRLGKTYPHARLEAACLRALQIGARNYGSVKSILASRLEDQPVFGPAAEAPEAPTSDSQHSNIRGSIYYN